MCFKNNGSEKKKNVISFLCKQYGILCEVEQNRYRITEKKELFGLFTYKLNNLSIYYSDSDPKNLKSTTIG